MFCFFTQAYAWACARRGGGGACVRRACLRACMCHAPSAVTRRRGCCPPRRCRRRRRCARRVNGESPRRAPLRQRLGGAARTGQRLPGPAQKRRQRRRRRRRSRGRKRGRKNISVNCSCNRHPSNTTALLFTPPTTPFYSEPGHSRRRKGRRGYVVRARPAGNHLHLFHTRRNGGRARF